jgi:hypothetical protein
MRALFKNAIKRVKSAAMSAVGAHWRALKSLFSVNILSNLGLFFARLGVIWPAVVSLLVGIAFLSITQGRDLFYDPVGWREWTVFAISLFLFWIVPIHLGSRTLLILYPGTRSAQSAELDKWLARDFGFAPLLFLCAVAISLVWDIDGAIAQADPVFIKAARNVLLVTIGLTVTSVLGYFLYLSLRSVARGKKSGEDKGERKAGPPDFFAGRAFWVYTLVTVVVALFAMGAPFFVASLAGRLVFLPILAGGWIMPLVALAAIDAKGGSLRVVMRGGITIVAIVFVVAGASNSNPFHDLRTFEGESGRHAIKRQASIQALVDNWKYVNGCDDAGKGTAKCRAVLVAAEGGASRAAFQVATIMGELLDERQRKPDAADLSRQIFALSGVSGGALGVATVRQALQDSKDGRPPCRTDARSHWMWQGMAEAPDVSKSWRACLQALVSGDYLTPAFVGLGLRDWWMPALNSVTHRWGLKTDDRSILLERAIENNYESITGKQCGSREGLCQPFGYVPMTEKQWLPRLILNSTMVERGRAIVISDIDPASEVINPTLGPSQKCMDPARRVYTDFMPTSYDLFELFGAIEKRPPQDGRKELNKYDLLVKDRVPDISLSTAIVASARFPFVSSQGNIRNENQEIVARLADGGYLDNSGLVSLIWLADFLECNGVQPVILSIRNDPTIDYQVNNETLWILPGRGEKLQPLLENKAAESYDLMNQILSPFATLNNSREGHVEQVKYLALKTVGESNFISARIFDRISTSDVAAPSACKKGNYRRQDVSMSWWLSPLTQRYIDLQLCHTTLPEEEVCDVTPKRGASNPIRRLLARLDCKADEQPVVEEAGHTPGGPLDGRVTAPIGHFITAE